MKLKPSDFFNVDLFQHEPPVHALDPQHRPLVYDSNPTCGHNRIMKSPPSFCNGLGTMYIASFRGRTIIITTRNMGSEFRYVLGNVLGTQDCPTLRLASHHCGLHLNLDKIMSNTCTLNSHTHTSIHLSIQHGVIYPKTHTYPSIKHKELNHTHTILAFI